jgi:proliferating cell nuclear antigen PCNA
MTVIFKAKTQDAYVIKLLGELLQNNIKTACFELDQKGIKLRMMDSHRHILIDLDLISDKFAIYKFKSERTYLGINLTHFHKMLKNIKKKDSITLFIDDDSPTDLGITVFPKENTRVTTSTIKIQGIQNVYTDIPTGYGKPVIVHSSEFQKTAKDLNNIGNVIKIISKGFHIKFLSDAGSVYSRVIILGEDDENDDNDDMNNEEYKQEFDTEKLIRITKISGLNNTMQIYPKKGLPLLFRSDVGSLGTISIYVKSKEQIEKDDLVIDETESDEGDEGF